MSARKPLIDKRGMQVLTLWYLYSKTVPLPRFKNFYRYSQSQQTSISSKAEAHPIYITLLPSLSSYQTTTPLKKEFFFTEKRSSGSSTPADIIDKGEMKRKGGGIPRMPVEEEIRYTPLPNLTTPNLDRGGKKMAAPTLAYYAPIISIKTARLRPLSPSAITKPPFPPILTQWRIILVQRLGLPVHHAVLVPLVNQNATLAAAELARVTTACHGTSHVVLDRGRGGYRGVAETCVGI